MSNGFWRSCSGCYESNEGYDVGPRDKTLGCHLGGGCDECGGRGAVWDDIDYGDFATFILGLDRGVKLPPQPDEAREGSQSPDDGRDPGLTPNPSFSKAEGRTP